MKGRNWQSFWRYTCVAFLGIHFSLSAAQLFPPDTSTAPFQNAAQESAMLERQHKVLKAQEALILHEIEQLQFTPPKTLEAAKKIQEKIQIRAALMQLQVDELGHTYQVLQDRIQKLSNDQKDLQLQLLNEQVQTPDEKSTQEGLTEMSRATYMSTQLIHSIQKTSLLAQENLKDAQNLLSLYQRYLQTCNNAIVALTKASRLQDLRNQIINEESNIKEWLLAIDTLNQLVKQPTEKTKNKFKDLTQQIIHAQQIFYNEQQIHLSNVRIAMLESLMHERQYEDILSGLSKSDGSILTQAQLDIAKKVLQEKQATLDEAVLNLQQYQQWVERHQSVLKTALQNDWVTESQQKSLMQNLDLLQKEIFSVRVLVQAEELQQARYISALQDYNTHMLASRQSLLKTGDTLTLGFFNQLVSLPQLVGLYGMGISAQTWEVLQLQTLAIKIWIGCVMIGGLIVFWIGKKYFAIFSQKMHDNRRRASNVVYILSELLRRNWGSLCLFFESWFLLDNVGMNFNAYLGLFYTALVWFAFRVIVGIARMLLVEREGDTQGHDVVLYHRLKWVFIIGGWATVLVVLSKQLGLTGMIANVSNRLFMIFLAMVAFVLIRARNLLPSLLDSYITRQYLKRAVRIVCWIWPLGLLISTVLGVLGYISLAWAFLYYQAMVVLVIVSYMILRGILIDIFEILAEWMIRHFEQGWLLREAFLKPLDNICRLSLFMGMILCIFLLFGWQHDSLVVTKLKAIFWHPFFYFSGVNVTLFSILETVLMIAFFIWLAKWTREFSYRWVFRNAKDVGIRHSLAVFCQYAVIALGLIVTLNVLGIDVSGISMILGGLAVGLGFGLRDFASNLVGGFMLLIERSVKEGDVVSVGEYEGEVTHIGIRAMRIRSWDHMEIMVPNAEILMKTFINWTHQDSIVRTVIPMKIHRVENPVHVQQMLAAILKNIPEVLSDPEPEIFFTNLNDALIDFEVRYFMNIALNTRASIRSKVVLAIVEAFEKEGIRPPYLQHDNYIWHMQQEDLNKP